MDDCYYARREALASARNDLTKSASPEAIIERALIYLDFLDVTIAGEFSNIGARLSRQVGVADRELT